MTRVDRALEVGRFDAVQATWNLLERSAGPALAAAHDAGLGVIIKEAVANGRLTDRGDVALIKAAALEVGVTPDALALAGVLAQPWVDVVLSGASTPEMLLSNLAAAELELPDNLLDRLDAVRETPRDTGRPAPRSPGTNSPVSWSRFFVRSSAINSRIWMRLI